MEENEINYSLQKTMTLQVYSNDHENFWCTQLQCIYKYNKYNTKLDHCLACRYSVIGNVCIQNFGGKFTYWSEKQMDC